MCIRIVPVALRFGQKKDVLVASHGSVGHDLRYVGPARSAVIRVGSVVRPLRVGVVVLGLLLGPHND